MESTPFKFKKVMVIDDTKIDRYVISYTLKKNDFTHEIVEYGMATSALDYFEKNIHNPELLPEVVILDVNMPEMNGFEFLEKLASLDGYNKRFLVIIMLSSSLNIADRERAEGNPIVKRFINKPLNDSSLNEIRLSYLELRSAEESLAPC